MFYKAGTTTTKEPEMDANTTAAVDTDETPELCTCGCGQRTNRVESQFLPGHDAKYVGKAIRLVMDPLNDLVFVDAPSILVQNPELNQSVETIEVDPAEYTSAAYAIRRRRLAVEITTKSLGRPRLAAKIEHGVNLAIAKAARQGDQAETRQPRAVKIGRWEYPTRPAADGGKLERNTRRDGAGEWIPADPRHTLVY